MKKYILNAPQVISEETAGETVVINLETGSYYNLNSEASKIWVNVINGVDVAELKSKIKSSSADKDTKIDNFFTKLVEENLVKDSAVSQPISHDINLNVDDLVLEVYTDMQDLLGLDPIHEAEPEAGWPVAKKS